MNSMKKLLVLGLSSAILATACGGGGGDGDDVVTNTSTSGGDTPSTNQPIKTQFDIQGSYKGNTSRGSQAARGIIDDNNNMWFIYTPEYQGGIDGLIKTDAIDSKKFSIIGQDYNFSRSTVYPITVSGTATGYEQIDGTVDYGRSEFVDFNITRHTKASERKLFSEDLALKTFKGEVGINGVGTESATVTIHSDGKLTAQGASGCKLEGTISDSASKGYVKLDFVFGAAPCALPNEKFSGVADYIDDELLMIGATNTNEQYGLVFGGSLLLE